MRIKENSTTRLTRRAERGATLVELCIVVILMAILGAVAIPQMYQSRRMLRSAALTRLVLTQIRNTRQQAMTERRPITLQFANDVMVGGVAVKQLNVIRHPPNPSGNVATLLNDPLYPNTTGSALARTIPLTDDKLPAGELLYGRPPGASTAALGDGTTLTTLPPSGRINITFQPDGSVVNAAGTPVNYALYFYNNKATNTAGAVSVLGSAGRVKLWRYNQDANNWIE